MKIEYFWQMTTIDHTYIDLFTEVKSRFNIARHRALQRVNKWQIAFYRNLGKTICERKKQHNWKKNVVELLAAELQKEFVGVNGFSVRNLWNMKLLYDQYHKSTLILPPLVAEIPWVHKN